MENEGLESLERAVNALGEIGEGCAELVAMFFEDGGDQNLFGWKVVVDAWLTNFDHLCDIRVTERRVAAISEEGVSGFEDSFCGITLHGGILPTGRLPMQLKENGGYVSGEGQLVSGQNMRWNFLSRWRWLE